jgi:hypothetical protein
MRIPISHRAVQADADQHLHDTGAALFAAEAADNGEWFGDGHPNGKARVERPVRVLSD